MNYFLHQEGYHGKVHFTNFIDGKVHSSEKRNLFEKDIDIIISNGKDYSIIQKVRGSDFVSINSITKGRNAFGITGKQVENGSITKSSFYDGSIKLRCKKNEILYCDSSLIKDEVKDILNNFKVFISKSAGDPAHDKKVIGEPYVGGPNETCTDSLIPIGNFKTKHEADNLKKYLKTKFLRYLVSILKTSQNVYQNVYQFVPLENFTFDSDIDWNNSIDEIDNQLFVKYKFSAQEIKFIKSDIC